MQLKLTRIKKSNRLRTRRSLRSQEPSVFWSTADKTISSWKSKSIDSLNNYWKRILALNPLPKNS